MRSRKLPLIGLVLTIAGAVFADDTSVVSVGETKLSAPELAGRLGRVQGFQLARYGSTPASARRAFVDQVVVPELLFAAEAKQRKLEESPGLQAKIRDVLKEAAERWLREETLRTDPVTPEAVKAYFEQNRNKFETPARVRVWRILLPDEASARKVIAAAKGPTGPQRWNEMARDQSLDKATSLRSGDLGFVRPDGTTDAPRVTVDKAVVQAAVKLSDGSVAPEPVKEGEHFAVVWRRGSMPEVKRTLAQEEESIRQLLERRKAEERRTNLLKTLRTEQVKEEHQELLEWVDTEAFGDPPARKPNKKASPKQRLRATPAEAPKPSDRGQR